MSNEPRNYRYKIKGQAFWLANVDGREFADLVDEVSGTLADVMVERPEFERDEMAEDIVLRAIN